MGQMEDHHLILQIKCPKSQVVLAAYQLERLLEIFGGTFAFGTLGFGTVT
jgi:hypothetical protein